MKELTQSMLKELLHYDPDNGDFTWLVSNSNRVAAGDIAGTIDNGYVRININKKLYQAHRLAFLYMEGNFPKKGLQVDHINHNRNDNKWKNLRIVTHKENKRNATMQRNNKSGHTGVHWNKSRNNWYSQIKLNGKKEYLGCFKNIEDAIAARKDAELKYNFHKNHGK